MKIIFFALYGTFGFSQIGGTDSYVRRLAFSLIKSEQNLEVEYVFYNANSNDVQKPIPHLIIRYFKKLQDVFIYLNKGKRKHVVTGYIRAKDRLRYANFRRKNNHTIFHKLEFFYPQFSLKRILKFYEISFTPYNGKVICASDRIYRHVIKKSKNAILLLPPIPGSYFVGKDTKKIGNKIRLTFLGRIDPRKGILEAIELFKKLNQDSVFDCKIYGILIPEDKKAIPIRNALVSQDKIEFIEIDRQNYSSRIDKTVKSILKSTDIFVQPYRNLESTVDTPLLLLEAMASLCVILTTSVGNNKELYGTNQYILPKNDFPDNAYKILKKISFNDLKKERARIWRQIHSMNIGQNQVAERFIDAIHN